MLTGIYFEHLISLMKCVSYLSQNKLDFKLCTFQPRGLKSLICGGLDNTVLLYIGTVVFYYAFDDF